ncbi:FtsW/RodA/SpoVE family cell cycle protein [Amycolatopsis acididurans]|uniref:FtsW/RodA/SpoVE family cell cycle protein n=1 Tax=Amycolatopsis acididurans TaxID=2724524 RepID=UPI0028AB6E9D|nr:FtsW/RodA/SpoVE family cell cycle protein [Amycolatopsis acididurans]
MDISGTARHRRTVELRLLAFALLLVLAAMVLVDLSQPSLPVWHGWTLALVFASLCGAAHVAIRRWAPLADPVLLPGVAVLNGLGLTMIHRLDFAYALAAQQEGSPAPAPDAPRQLLWTAVSVALFAAVVALVHDHRKLSRYTYLAGLLGLVLLVLPGLLPASLSEVNGAKLWLRLGPLSIQPVELSKILVIVFAAGFLVAKRHLFTSAGKQVLGMELPRARDLGPLLVMWLASVCVVTFEKELGAALLFFGVALAMIYIATERVSWVLAGLCLFVVGCVAAYTMFTHIQQRVSTWLDPVGTYDQPGGGYQVSQSLFGLGTGGLTGTGLGQGRPDLVPFAGTDFISGAFGEELGFTGLAAIVVLYLLLTTRGLRAALAARDNFGKLLAGGLSFSLALQVFVVVGGVTALIPLAGMTLPWLSYGGSSLLTNYLALALLLRVSDAGAAVDHRTRAAAPAPLAEAATVLVGRLPQGPDVT